MLTAQPPLRTGFRINPGKGWMLMMPGADPAPLRQLAVGFAYLPPGLLEYP